MRHVLLACSVALLALVAAGPAWADDDDGRGEIESAADHLPLIYGERGVGQRPMKEAWQ